MHSHTDKVCSGRADLSSKYRANSASKYRFIIYLFGISYAAYGMHQIHNHTKNEYSPCLFLLHFQRAEKVSTKTGMSTITGMCQHKANLRRFIQDSRYTVRRHICCVFKTPKTCQHIGAALYILLLEGQKSVNIWGVNICDAGQ